MIASGSLALASLLFIAGSTHAQQLSKDTAQHNPYLILPPGSSSEYRDGAVPRDIGDRVFTLRHIYHRGTHAYPDLHRYLDISPEDELRVTIDDGLTYHPAPRTLRTKATSTNIQRLVNRKAKDIDLLLDHVDTYGEPASLPSSAWNVDETAGPNITDKTTIISFAKMAANAYVQEHNKGEWQSVGGGFNYTDDFGWEADGLRGHIFADERNQTVVIGLKGTTTAVFDGVDTTGNDKLNDNLFGSCCCGQGGNVLWKSVCNCMDSTYSCNATCVRQSLREKGRYYWAVRDLYHNVTERYPGADVWLSGHSLGGVVSSLLGLTYGLPTLTFEAFPDALAASRLGLPTPPGYSIGAHQSRNNLGIYHFGHTADPVYTGTCNSATSLCTLAGYAFQSGCHTGMKCTYDTVGDLGWRASVGTHRITSVIRDVLEKYDGVPTCEEESDCVDCYNWKYFESNGSKPITSTSSSSSSIRTRTATCQTPGWWGCLDESTTATTTTTTTTTSSSTSSTSTSTCKTPGWFGCKDPTTTAASSTMLITTTSSAQTTSSSPSTTCLTPGWFGCKDSTTSATTTPAQPSSSAAETTPAPTSEPVSASSVPTGRRRKCNERHWYGTCKDWENAELDFKFDL